MSDNITLPREVVQEALEALERSVAICFSEYDHREVLSDSKHFVNQAIFALRAALAAPQPEPESKTPATIDEMFDRMNKVPRGMFYGHDPMTIWMEAWRAAEWHHNIKEQPR